MTRDGGGAPRVRIRVKERIARDERPSARRSGSPEKVVLVVVGACLGLGIGYLLAGKLVSLLRPPAAAVRTADRGPREDGGGAAPAAPATEFDLPAQGE